MTQAAKRLANLLAEEGYTMIAGLTAGTWVPVEYMGGEHLTSPDVTVGHSSFRHFEAFILGSPDDRLMRVDLKVEDHVVTEATFQPIRPIFIPGSDQGIELVLDRGEPA